MGQEYFSLLIILHFQRKQNWEISFVCSLEHSVLFKYFLSVPKFQIVFNCCNNYHTQSRQLPLEHSSMLMAEFIISAQTHNNPTET